LLRINEFEQRPDGSSRIGTIGVRRFKVLKWAEKDNYLTGEVQWIRDLPYNGPPVIGVEIGPLADPSPETEGSAEAGAASASAPQPDFGPDFSPATTNARPSVLSDFEVSPRRSGGMKLQIFDMSDNSIPDFSPAPSHMSPKVSLARPGPSFRTTDTLVTVDWKAAFRRDAIWTMRVARRRWASYDTIFALTGRGMLKLSALVLSQQGSPPEILKPLHYTRVHKEPIPLLFSDGLGGEGGAAEEVEVQEDVTETGREEDCDKALLLELEKAPQMPSESLATGLEPPKSPGSSAYMSAAEDEPKPDPAMEADLKWEREICVPMVDEALDCCLALRDDATNTISRAVFWMYAAESVGGHVTDSEVYKFLFAANTRHSLWNRLKVLQKHLVQMIRENEEASKDDGFGKGKGKGKGLKGASCPVQ